jgi:hypothetical protein
MEISRLIEKLNSLLEGEHAVAALVACGDGRSKRQFGGSEAEFGLLAEGQRG